MTITEKIRENKRTVAIATSETGTINIMFRYIGEEDVDY